MKNRIGKILEKKILIDIDPELLANIEHFLNEHTKAYKLMTYMENPQKLDDDWNPDWGNKPYA
jgi:hypothetical protein